MHQSIMVPTLIGVLFSAACWSQDEVAFPPQLPRNRQVVSDHSERFLLPPASLREGVEIAKTPPTVDFLYYPGQDYPGKPWSCWGDSLAVNGKYYSSIGDHLAISGKGDRTDGNGSAFVYEYDPTTKAFRQLADTSRLLELPADQYAPGKIHTRLDMGKDGCLYFATHRGSTRATTDAYGYQGDWILRCDLGSGKAAVVVHAPVPKHCIPNGRLDPERMIYYGGTAAGTDAAKQAIYFFAHDVTNQEMLYSGPDGPARYTMLASSTGRLYYVPGKGVGPLMRFDPKSDGAPVIVEGTQLGIRAATEETADQHIYTVSLGQRADDADIWSFDTQTEHAEKIGTAPVGSQSYVASLDVGPNGRYLYYVPGAHGGSPRDGTPVVQFDVKTGKKKVLAFLEPFYTEKYGLTLKGTYATAIDAAGEKLFITWNVSRGTRAWDSCGITVVHIPPSERQP